MTAERWSLLEAAATYGTLPHPMWLMLWLPNGQVGETVCSIPTEPHHPNPPTLPAALKLFALNALTCLDWGQLTVHAYKQGFPVKFLRSARTTALSVAEMQPMAADFGHFRGIHEIAKWVVVTLSTIKYHLHRFAGDPDP